MDPNFDTGNKRVTRLRRAYFMKKRFKKRKEMEVERQNKREVNTSPVCNRRLQSLQGGTEAFSNLETAER